jgi:hypothetical protein
MLSHAAFVFSEICAQMPAYLRIGAILSQRGQDGARRSAAAPSSSAGPSRPSLKAGGADTRRRPPGSQPPQGGVRCRGATPRAPSETRPPGSPGRRPAESAGPQDANSGEVPAEQGGRALRAHPQAGARRAMAPEPSQRLGVRGNVEEADGAFSPVRLGVRA